MLGFVQFPFAFVVKVCAEEEIVSSRTTTQAIERSKIVFISGWFEQGKPGSFAKRRKTELVKQLFT
jgi:hypothetical protein